MSIPGLGLPGVGPLGSLDPIRGPGSPLDREIIPGILSERFRPDSHAPYGEHINYENWVNIGGKNFRIVNGHIPI